MAPLWCLTRLGIGLTLQEELAYIASWRHIGYYLGSSPTLLRKHYSPPSSTADPTHRFFACISFHLYAEPIVPENPYATSTYRVLQAVSDRPPQNKSTLYHCELSRALFGPGLSDRLALPRGTWTHRMDVHRYRWYSWSIAHFARYYRASWDLRRQELFRTIIVTMVAWQLGERRSKYTWKNEEDHGKRIDQLSSDLYRDEGETSGLQFGVDVEKKLKLEAGSIFLEMGIVLLGLAMAVIAIIWQVYLTFRP